MDKIKIFYRNIHTDVILSEEEYEALLEREAKEHWEENLKECQEQYDSFDELKNSMQEEDGDFELCDDEGNAIDLSEY